MPLSAELEKVLGLIQDPTEREARRKELTQLHENGLRQEDYSRKMNEVQTQHKKNVEWFNTAKGQYEEARGQVKNLSQKVAELEAAKASLPDDELDQSELQKQLRDARAELDTAKKTVGDLSSTVTNLKTMLDEGKLVTQDKFLEEVNKRGDALGAAVLDIIDLQEKCRRDFGKDLDRKALLEEAGKRGGDLHAAYDVLTKADGEAKLRKDIENNVRKEWEDKMKNSSTPYAPSGEPTLGPLQQRLQKKDTGIPDDVAADGSGRLAGLIASELRAEGKM